MSKAKDLFGDIPGQYAAHWGLTNFYERHEKALKEAIVRDGSFETGMFGCKKEIHYANIWSTSKRRARCKVITYMDDGMELADTAVWAATDKKYDSGDSALRKLAPDLSERQREKILEMLMEACGIQDEDNSAVEEARCKRSFVSIRNCLNRLATKCEVELEKQYRALVRQTRETLPELIEQVRLLKEPRS